jgi:hypothetical protein
MSRSHEEHDSTTLEREEVSLETQEVRLLKQIVFLLAKLISLVEGEEPPPPVEMFLPTTGATFTQES